ncbi:uncharacterized protein LOC114934706 [Nylanderia fulva]|uniref:uncharacterized protein LOC114934706 n=1 Tax=Nylanderia fulva TaxID=613905 RepID=UPI0010FB3083|nr:uncharacterized protein LOC114934706 [Nylanderia fulva]
MSIFSFNGFLLLGFAVATVPNVLMLGLLKTTKIVDQNPSPTMCNYSRANSILKAQCSNRKLRKISLDLKANIQVLDIIGNQVIELKNENLLFYKKLVFIYLNENYIHNIKEIAFVNQPYLEVLDLTDNL